MKRFRPKLVVPLIFLTAVIWAFREPIRKQIRESATLANDTPTPEVVSDMIEQAADPRAALLAAWNSGKIAHREVAIAVSRGCNQPGNPCRRNLIRCCFQRPLIQT